MDESFKYRNWIFTMNGNAIGFFFFCYSRNCPSYCYICIGDSATILMDKKEKNEVRKLSIVVQLTTVLSLSARTKHGYLPPVLHKIEDEDASGFEP